VKLSYSVVAYPHKDNGGSQTTNNNMAADSPVKFGPKEQNMLGIALAVVAGLMLGLCVFFCCCRGCCGKRKREYQGPQPQSGRSTSTSSARGGGAQTPLRPPPQVPTERPGSRVASPIVDVRGGAVPSAPPMAMPYAPGMGRSVRWSEGRLLRISIDPDGLCVCRQCGDGAAVHGRGGPGHGDGGGGRGGHTQELQDAGQGGGGAVTRLLRAWV
jgi:hypothetical protein